MSTEENLTNANKVTTYNFLEESYCITRLLIFFINEITKTTKNQEKFDDGKVNNVCSVAPLKSRFTRWYVFDRFSYFCFGGWYQIVWRKALQRDTDQMEWCHRLWNYERWNYEVLFQLSSDLSYLMARLNDVTKSCAGTTTSILQSIAILLWRRF